MNIDNQLLFLFSAIGGFNGVFLSLYFLVRKPGQLSDKLLGLLLMMISIRIIKSVFFYFNPELTKTFLQIGLTACFFIGPFCYFYVLSKLDSLTEQWVDWKVHLALLVTLSLLFGVLYPYHFYPEIWTIAFKFIYLQWLTYLLLSTYAAKHALRAIFTSQETQNEHQQPFLVNVLTGCWVIWAAFFFSSYTSYIAGALSFTFILYLSVFVAVLRFRAKSKEPVFKYADKKIAPAEASILIEKLENLMVHKQLYRDANLTLPEVAKQLGILTQRLSQLLNDNLNKSFPLFVNEYRIEAAKVLLTGEKAMKMEDIAEQCGFNSNSTFYTAFKRFADKTPAKYRDEHKSN